MSEPETRVRIVDGGSNGNVGCLVTLALIAVLLLWGISDSLKKIADAMPKEPPAATQPEQPK
jgi:hypothetical protein